MTLEAKALVQAVERTKEASELAQKALELFRQRCSHKWDDPKGVYDPKHHKGYTIPADPPGTMGVDRRTHDFYVADTTEDRWTRTCTICGLKQGTTNTRDEVKKVPEFK